MITLAEARALALRIGYETEERLRKEREMRFKFPQIEAPNEPILHVDMTPDEDLPLRILRAYRSNCDCRWVAEPPSPLWDAMNADQERRAKILDLAIAKLQS
jgi:hypothetical protein